MMLEQVSIVIDYSVAIYLLLSRRRTAIALGVGSADISALGCLTPVLDAEPVRIIFDQTSYCIEICFDWVQAAGASVIRRIDFSPHALPCRVSDQVESSLLKGGGKTDQVFFCSPCTLLCKTADLRSCFSLNDFL